jgi:hypothetical protein
VSQATEVRDGVRRRVDDSSSKLSDTSCRSGSPALRPSFAVDIERTLAEPPRGAVDEDMQLPPPNVHGQVYPEFVDCHGVSNNLHYDPWAACSASFKRRSGLLPKLRRSVEEHPLSTALFDVRSTAGSSRRRPCPCGPSAIRPSTAFPGGLLDIAERDTAKISLTKLPCRSGPKMASLRISTLNIYIV